MKTTIFCQNSIGLLILAGGSARRMGRDKATLTIGNRTFAEQLLSAMGEYDEKLFSVSSARPVTSGGPAILVTSDSSRIPEGFEIVEDDDRFKGMGPAAGIATALRLCKSRWLMVVPCDAPFVDQEVARTLWEKALRQGRKGQAEITKGQAEVTKGQKRVPVLASGPKGPEPLIGLYPKDVCGLMEKRLLAGKRKVIEIIEDTGYIQVPIDSKKLLNINSPEDYRAIRENSTKYE